MPNIPEEIKQLSYWWTERIREKAGGAIGPLTFPVFEVALAETLSEGLPAQFSVSLYYRDTVPPALVAAARSAQIGDIKRHLTPFLYSRAQPGEVLVQIGDRTSCHNIFNA